MKTETVNISKIKSNPNNPRTIRDEKFKNLVQSIKDFPEMLNIRPIVVNEQMVVLGGNMRLKACIEAGVKEVPVIITKLSEQKQKEFIIKDNVSGGEWNWYMLANEWEEEELKQFGLDLPEEWKDNSEEEIWEKEKKEENIKSVTNAYFLIKCDINDAPNIFEKLKNIDEEIKIVQSAN